jgi:hypothetical protein
MNKIRLIIVAALTLILTVPCFGNNADIKRKKKKEISSELLFSEKFSDNVSNCERSNDFTALL